MADKAFLTAINDYRTIGDLRGCVNDTVSLKNLLIDHFGFNKNAIRVRHDARVTKAELRKGWKWLLSDAKPGDRLVFHFSGHGSYTADQDGDEPNGADELLCLYSMDWSDPDSYLLDDELRQWTSEIPEEVSVTFVLDCCHSGTGTRMVPPPVSRSTAEDFRQASSLVDLTASRNRLAQASKQTRSAAAEDEVTDLERILPSSSVELGPASVLARFAPPPPEIDAAVQNAKKRHSFLQLSREMATRSAGAGEPMNHVLWAGSRDDQTSADAFINGDYHGAFTHYFCEAVRAESSRPSAQKVMERVREKLRQQGFTQIPQLEPSDTASDVFQVHRDDSDTEPEPSLPPSDGDAAADPAADDFKALISSLQQLVDQLSQNLSRQSDPAGQADRAMVYVHGICQHPPGFSDRWWDALAPHLPTAVRQTLAANRHEVLWSRHVSPVARALPSSFDPVQQREMEQRLRDVLQERVTREVADQIEQTAAAEPFDARSPGLRAVESTGPIARAAFGIPGADCVDDFVKYLVNDQIRANVLNEFRAVVRPLLARGQSIELISHSWGTVVAFEGLRQLDAEGLPGRVHSWFTVGAALAIAFVATRLRPGDGRKPAVVQRWINLDARADAVGGSLQAVGMQIDAEFLKLEPTGCRSLGPFVAPACSHSSYFHSKNFVVNRDIFAGVICR